MINSAFFLYVLWFIYPDVETMCWDAVCFKLFYSDHMFKYLHIDINMPKCFYNANTCMCTSQYTQCPIVHKRFLFCSPLQNMIVRFAVKFYNSKYFITILNLVWNLLPSLIPVFSIHLDVDLSNIMVRSILVWILRLKAACQSSVIAIYPNCVFLVWG